MKKLLLVFLLNMNIVLIFSYPLANQFLVDEVDAGSYIFDDRKLYLPSHICDGTKLSWAENLDGVEPSKQGFTVKFKETVTISSFSLKNGYGDYDYFKSNNRIKKLLMIAGEFQAEFSLTDNPGFQEFKLEHPIDADSIMFFIKEMYPGTKYNDICLSEMFFNVEYGRDGLNIKNQFELNDFVESSFFEISKKIYSVFEKMYDFKVNDSEEYEILCKKLENFSRINPVLLPTPDGKVIYLARIQSDWIEHLVDDPRYLPVFMDFLFVLDGENIIMDNQLYPNPYEFIDMVAFDIVRMKDGNTIVDLLDTFYSIELAGPQTDPSCIENYLNILNTDEEIFRRNVSRDVLRRELELINRISYDFDILGCDKREIVKNYISLYLPDLNVVSVSPY